MSTEYSNRAIQAVLNGEIGFCKFLSANDTGKTGESSMLFLNDILNCYS